ncbi:hypothetical protein F7725_022690 [Dissostichus mawsoni]|uniref:Ammonium transporter AmtB-like domain-containing protein n=1 Tax=Dissostichus mawsoni TaxID=36200 RepID=A0A7J5YYM9_DISMA|nr:hypothetical protein F7725_022690 [Dissostichus mawsoni]
MENEFYFRYPSFQDVHVMIFVGFGFLMTFLKRYSFGAVGFNFLIAAFGLQWGCYARLVRLPGPRWKDQIGIESLINADFCVASCLIAYGAVLGKVSAVQLMVMTLFGITLFAVEEHIIIHIIHVSQRCRRLHGDPHLWSLLWSFHLVDALSANLNQSSRLQCSVYHSDVFAMIGPFLWMFWPSFNSAIADHGDGQHRAAINTYLALASTVLTTVHIQNSTLAGGVAVGTAAEFMLMPYGSLIVGFCCGIISTLGYIYLTPFMEKYLKIQDTCGIHNLHAMPGVIGGTWEPLLPQLQQSLFYGVEGEWLTNREVI